MPGLDRSTPTPVRIVVHRQSRVLEIEFDNGRVFRLPFELLRVQSPSAEVRGHGPGQEVLQFGKKDVDIVSLDPVGHYAVQPRFSDGHETGIFSWDYLFWLGDNQARIWEDYLERLRQAGKSREPVVVALSSGPAAAPEASTEASSSSAVSGARSVSRPRT